MIFNIRKRIKERKEREYSIIERRKESMEERTPSLENWNDFLGKYFKAEMVKSWPASVVVNKVSARYNEDDVAQLTLEVVYDEKKYLYEPNVTNTKIIKSFCPQAPLRVHGKKFYFSKVKARNPKTGLSVDSLEIEKIA